MSKFIQGLGYGVIGLFILFILAPILIIIPVSFGENMFQFPPAGFSVELYQQLLQDDSIISSVWLSFYIGIVSMIVACLIGLLAALGITKGNFPFKGVFESFFLGPLIVPFVTTGIGFLIFFIPLNLTDSPVGIIIAHSVIISPYVVRICIATLRQLDGVLEEAAIVHGASSWYLFRTVVLPQVSPALIAGGLLAFLVSIDEYTVTVFLAQADTITLPIRIFQYVTMDINPVVTALSSVSVILSFILIIVLEKKLKIHKYLEL